ncbi:LysR family transcriptional regulator [Actinobacillus vicugnae]|uniref:LysR family transcriptional regulator n=1 Tax=Actinobacillus vicugnae TaxID=2573093 RepID=UPI001241FB45|nr:LysR family transcriptional regulator [Actinobacillus vicugnae]
MYDYKAMLVFVTVVEQGTMQAAAEKLSMTPSAVTQSIKKLENQLKIKLLSRTTRKLSLTDAGNIFYQHISHIQQTAENAIRSIEALHSEPVGELKIASVSGLIDTFLSGHLKSILDNYPEIQLELTIKDSLIELSQQKFDILLHWDISDEHMVARHLYDFEWVIVAHPDYIKHHGLPSNLSELEKLDWISYPNNSSKQLPIQLSKGKDNETFMPYHRISCNSLNTAKTLLLNGFGVTQLPIQYIQKQLDSGELITLCPDWKLPQTPLYLVTPQRIQSEKVRIASQLIIDYFKHLS